MPEKNKTETPSTAGRKESKPDALKVIQEALKANGIKATTNVVRGVRGETIAVNITPDKE